MKKILLTLLAVSLFFMAVDGSVSKTIAADSILIDGNCEDGAIQNPGWAGQTGLTFIADDASSGSQCIEMVVAPGDTGVHFAINQDYIPVKNASYRLTFSCKTLLGMANGDSGAGIQLMENGVFMGGYVAVFPIITDGEWQTFVTDPIFVSESITTIQVLVFGGWYGYSAGTIRFDDFVLERVETVIPVNGDCEEAVNGVPGWSFVANTAFSTNDDAGGGGQCIEILAADGVGNNYAVNQAYAVDAYTSVSFSVDVKTLPGYVDGGDNYVLFRFFNELNADTGGSCWWNLTPTDGVWQRLDFQTIAPYGTTKMDFLVIGSHQGLSTGTIRFDNASIVVGETAYPEANVSYYDGEGTDPNAWFDPVNWNAGVPTPGDMAIVPHTGALIAGNWPVIDSATPEINILAVAWNDGANPIGKVYITDGGSLAVTNLNHINDGWVILGNLAPCEGYIYMDGGELTTTLMQIGNLGYGQVNQSGGQMTATQIQIGLDGNGKFNLSGGELTVGQMQVGTFGAGVFNQSGGVVNILNNDIAGLSFSDQDGATFGTGLYNMTGDATLILAGDQTAYVNDTLIGWGMLTADDGSGVLLVDYNATNAGKTTVRVQLCSSYFDGDFDQNCTVNYKDLMILVQEWLNPPIEWVADMSTDPVASEDWTLRAGLESANNYTIQDGLMVIGDGTQVPNVVVDTDPAIVFGEITTMTAKFRTTTVGSGIYGPVTFYLPTDTDEASYAILAITAEKISETEQQLGVYCDNVEILRLSGFGTGMIEFTAVVDVASEPQTITIDATDGTTSYVGETVTYLNGQPGTVGATMASVASYAFAGEVDYFTVSAGTEALYDLTNDGKTDFQDFAKLAENWLGVSQ